MARPTPQGPPPRAHDRDAVRTAFFRVFPGVMLAMFLAAVDQTILASALPAIVASFGGFADLSWVVTAYLLAATVAAPFYGRIGDRLGRRTTLLAALAVFTLASAAWLGPAIGRDAFEVGADVHDAFVRSDADAAAAFVAGPPGKWHADLFALAQRRLARAGVHSIDGGGLCTHSDRARFFSFRRDGTSERMGAFLWRTERLA